MSVAPVADVYEIMLNDMIDEERFGVRVGDLRWEGRGALGPLTQ